MMIFGKIVFCLAAVNSVFCLPANNDLLDKATVNDIAVNTVSDDKKTAEAAVVQKIPAEQAPSPSTVEISGISTGVNNPPPLPVLPTEAPTPFKPQRAGSMFARIIDDIFQIPITVLQNVAKLITNPFTRKEPTVTATVS